ncbi:hypothetical protein L208DRAFT_1111382, partial [Tricholoma matsutake]
MTKIVNSLSAKLEMGSPMGCMYLLGNPDHYTNYGFTPFYWKSFVQEARKPWEPKKTSSQQSEKIAIFKHNSRVVYLSPVHDYVFHPPEFHSICLYDWISRHQRAK